MKSLQLLHFFRLLLRVSLPLFLFTHAFSSWAGNVVDQNPFDPERKPWTTPPPPPPPLPELTAKDLQIEAVLVFGSHKVIIAQLDGRLKGVLPANAAGKVRIRIGQSFGGGYVLGEINANQAIVLAGSARYTIPVVRRSPRGAAPATSQPIIAESTPPPPSPAPAVLPAPATIPTPPSGSAAPPSPTANPFAAPPMQQAPPAFAGVAAPPAEALSASTVPQGSPEPAVTDSAAASAAPAQPMTLLDAIRKAQEAGKNRQNPSQGGVPFGAK